MNGALQLYAEERLPAQALRVARLAAELSCSEAVRLLLL